MPKNFTKVNDTTYYRRLWSETQIAYMGDNGKWKTSTIIKTKALPNNQEYDNLEQALKSFN
jgi:hypothetical protein